MSTCDFDNVQIIDVSILTIALPISYNTRVAFLNDNAKSPHVRSIDLIGFCQLVDKIKK